MPVFESLLNFGATLGFIDRHPVRRCLYAIIYYVVYQVLIF